MIADLLPGASSPDALMAAPHRPSPFSIATAELQPLGFNCVPLLPPSHDSDGRGKAPGVYRSGRWNYMTEWQKYRDRLPGDFELRLWTQNWPEANAGMLMGTPAGAGLALKLLSVDIDTTDPDAFDEIQRACPPTPMIKRGQKGETRFYAAPAEIKSRGYKVAGKTVLDLLTGNQTRQTVVPPSIHPDGPTYVWVAGPVAAADLPVFDEDALAVLEETLETLGWGASDAEKRISEAHAENRIGHTKTMTPRDPDEPPTVWRDLNDEALARLGDWVPALDLYGLRPVRRGGYEATATWRDSNSGQPTEKRKKNLKIHPDGIRDMGDDRGYSALDLVQAAQGSDLDTAFGWLNEKLGRRVEVIQLPLKAQNIAAEAAALADIRAAAPSPAAQEPPASLFRPPGLVGDLVDWICDTSKRPQPALALGAALTIVGTAAGRQFAGPTRSATHLYVLALARTAAGKDHPLKMVLRVLHAAGLGAHVGPSQFMSMPAVLNMMTRSPLAICPMDEFGSFLKRINSRRASGFEGAISGILRTAWGSSFQPMTTPEWAHVESRTIFAPALSIYGTSTPEEFYESLAAGDPTNGFLNRFLIVEGHGKPKLRKELRDPSVVPDEIVTNLRALYYARGELFASSLNQADIDRAPAIVPWADDAAEQAFEALVSEIDDGDHDALTESLQGRTVEIAVRLATICALGREGGIARVSAEDMAWGRDVAMLSTTRLIEGVQQHMHANEFQANVREIERLIRGAPGQTVRKGELTTMLRHKLKGQEIDATLASLIEAGTVAEVPLQAGGKGRPPTLYRLVGAPGSA